MNKENRMLRKSRLRFAYAGLSKELQQQIREEYRNLLQENQGMSRYMKQHMTRSILPAVSFCRVLQAAGFRRSQVFQLIRSSVLETAKPTGRFLSLCGKLPFFFPVFRRICRLSMNERYCGDEWKFIWKKNNPDRIEWECHSCIYYNRFRQYGMPQLTMIFCESDDVVYGSIPKARWGRTQTIGRGAKYCDFRFYQEGRFHK